MKIVGPALLVFVIVGGFFWWTLLRAQPAATVPSSTTEINGSSDQGNLGQSDDGSVQPGAIGRDAVISPGSQATPIVGDNLMLGLDGNSKLGTYLIGYTGRTLYTYAKDNIGTSTCYDDCATAWPPYIVSSSDRMNTQYGVDATKAGTITRTDGALQVTYNGLPLYFYSGDAAGTASGQGLGGVWYVMKP